MKKLINLAIMFLIVLTSLIYANIQANARNLDDNSYVRTTRASVRTTRAQRRHQAERQVPDMAAAAKINTEKDIDILSDETPVLKRLKNNYENSQERDLPKSNLKNNFYQSNN